ncbi:MAG: hypothetical protein ABIQ64_03455 [Candidatus Saccharimonadales bacterium]
MTDMPNIRRYYGPGGSVSWMAPEVPRIPEQIKKPTIKVRLNMAFVALRSILKDITHIDRQDY